ncbi:MAG: hypothetical protein WBG70_02300 [Spirulinaceae cyanobacterium]
MIKLQDTVPEKIALAFAHSLATGEYQAAYEILSNELRKVLSPSKLKEEYENMIEYIDSPLESSDLVNLLDDWPNKKEQDRGWAYVEFCFDGEVEGIAVIITQEIDRYVVSEIEWGRP